jgi:tRNA-specific adenosine deaminase 3
MEQGSITVEAVLADEVYRDVELVPMLCAEITDKKQTSDIIRLLNRCFPLSEYTHLKRVRGGQQLRVLVCELESESREHVELSSTRVRELGVAGLGQTSVVLVPKWKPLTRKQYDTVSTLWPTHFHEDKVLEKNLQGDIFSSLELLQIRKFMQIAFDENSNSENAQVSSAVVIVDPDINSVIAQAHTDSSHPLKHAAMLCLDQVASVQGGGVWEKRHGSRHGEQTALNTEKQLQERSIDLAIAEDLKCPPAKRAKCHDQYLCTGYDVYCTTEPCIM